jgi:hypothetical protein
MVGKPSPFSPRASKRKDGRPKLAAAPTFSRAGQTNADLIAASAFEPSAQALALLAGVRQAEEDLRLAGGAFPLEDVLTLLRITRQAVHNKVREGSLFVVKGPGGRLLFPTLQFTEDGPIKGLKDVIKAFPSANRWRLLNFFVHSDHFLHGSKPIDVLKSGDISRVVKAARALGEQGGEALPKQGYRHLYARAFEEFGAAALWNKKQLAEPLPNDALAVARALRLEGNLKARRLAEEIEAAAHAAH